MVVFTCSSCGESLKKNQVEKHYQFQCRNCQYVTCMDCNKEFWGNDYEKHTKCVSEDMRYGGKDYVPKPNANKGEVKQETWTEHVKRTVATTQVPRHIAVLMEQLTNFQNVPRKKVKFENFVRNSLKLRDPKVIGEVWELFAKAQEASPKSPHQTPNPTPRTDAHNSHQLDASKPAAEGLPEMKKRKRLVSESDQDTPNKKAKCDDELPLEPENRNGDGKTKFKWTKVIKGILRGYHNSTMSVKKLQKKVLKEYRTSQNGYSIEKDELKNKLQAKISKCAKLKMEGDQITLNE